MVLSYIRRWLHDDMSAGWRDPIHIQIGVGIEIDSGTDRRRTRDLALTGADFDSDLDSDFGEDKRQRKPTSRLCGTVGDSGPTSSRSPSARGRLLESWNDKHTMDGISGWLD